MQINTTIKLIWLIDLYIFSESLSSDMDASVGAGKITDFVTFKKLTKFVAMNGK